MKKLLLILLIAFCLNVNAQIITTIAGNGTQGYSGDGGQATAAQLYGTQGVFVDSAGNVFITDQVNNRIRKVNISTGIITTIAGNGTAGYAGDGAAATSAELNTPIGIFVDGFGNVFFSDALNNVIRKVNGSTGIITTIAGNGTTGSNPCTACYGGDGGAATSAELYLPKGVFVDSTNNVFIADRNNNRIRKVNGSTGIITTIAGTGTKGYAGDGGVATNAELFCPEGIFVDGSGNVFFSDYMNNVIRKVNGSTGIITTIAGNGFGAGTSGGYTGDGGQATSAELFAPTGVFVDSCGNLFFSDELNNVIRKVNNSTGIITTIAGTGTMGYSGDGGAATNAKLFYPNEIFIDGSGNLFIADLGNNVIRKVSNTGCATAGIEQFANNKEQVNIYPNPTSNQFFIETNTTDKLNVDLYDVNGRHVFSASVNDKSKIDVTNLNVGVYSLTIKTADRVINKKLVILR